MCQICEVTQEYPALVTIQIHRTVHKLVTVNLDDSLILQDVLGNQRGLFCGRSMVLVLLVVLTRDGSTYLCMLQCETIQLANVRTICLLTN